MFIQGLILFPQLYRHLFAGDREEVSAQLRSELSKPRPISMPVLIPSDTFPSADGLVQANEFSPGPEPPFDHQMTKSAYVLP
jgi:hypothetical protein